MHRINFREMEQSEATQMLPQLFSILYTNMSVIAPTNCSYEEDEKIWMEYALPAFRSGQCRILLIYVGETLAGYFQYSIAEDTLYADEVEIKPEYQRTMVFYRLCQNILSVLPPQVKYITSYVRKGNRNSISIHDNLGMERIGENRTGSSWQYRGIIANAAARFKR